MLPVWHSDSMNSPTDSSELCAHTWSQTGSQLSFSYTIDYWQGATTGLVQCTDCRNMALIHLQAWSGTNLTRRVYSVALLNQRVAQTFLRNMRSDYCDLSRKASEVDALISVANPVETVLLVDGQTVIRILATETSPPTGYHAWREALPYNDSWLSHFKDRSQQA